MKSKLSTPNIRNYKFKSLIIALALLLTLTSYAYASHEVCGCADHSDCCDCEPPPDCSTGRVCNGFCTAPVGDCIFLCTVVQCDSICAALAPIAMQICLSGGLGGCPGGGALSCTYDGGPAGCEPWQGSGPGCPAGFHCHCPRVRKHCGPPNSSSSDSSTSSQSNSSNRSNGNSSSSSSQSCNDPAQYCSATGGCCPDDNVCLPSGCCPYEDWMPRDNVCCSDSTKHCGGKCCGAGDICIDPNNSTCCATSQVCGNACCAPGEQCMPQNHACCAGDRICGNACCPEGQACSNPDTGECEEATPTPTPIVTVVPTIMPTSTVTPGPGATPNAVFLRN